MVLCYFPQICLTKFWQYFYSMPECNPCSLFCLLPYIFVTDDTCPLFSNGINFLFFFTKA